MRKHIADRQAAATDGTDVCVCCGGYMKPGECAETERVAQFSFSYTYPVSVCQDCGSRSVRMDDLHVITEVFEMAALRVGLPCYGDQLWTDEIGEERRRRGGAPPEIEITVTPGMSAGEAIGCLDAELARRGRPFGAHPATILT